MKNEEKKTKSEILINGKKTTEEQEITTFERTVQPRRFCAEFCTTKAFCVIWFYTHNIRTDFNFCITTETPTFVTVTMITRFANSVSTNAIFGIFFTAAARWKH